ncbi:KIF-binding protein-like [Clavelina lepadiformis]|uniref:KIF-binding protein-like n=1 Tax=Clavelina lepadiformis TaxID=159417 RepID=UPI004041239E
MFHKQAVLSIMDILAEACENYEKAKELSEVTDDPESEPFLSKYKARQLLEGIRKKIRERHERNVGHDLMLCKEAAVEYQLGVNHIQTEEISAGQEKLVRVLNLCHDDIKLESRAVSIVVASLNELGILWSNREGGIMKAQEYLNKAESLYHEYKNKYDEAPFNIDEHFSMTPTEEYVRQQGFENLHTLTLFYLAQVYKSLEKSDLSASYCVKTLQRQLEFKTYKPLEWAVHCACLSQYYIQRNMFRQAKHCISCATAVLLEDSSVEEENEKEEQVKADVARCWVKYCLNLLDTSKDRISPESESPLAEDQDFKDFDRFSLEVTNIEENTPHDFCTSYDQARKVFLLGKEHATQALNFFVLDGFVTDHVEIHQDISRLYQYLAFFESNVEMRCRMYKRRIDLLTPILNELNKQFYLLICRQLQFELAETYSEMMDMKIALGYSDGQPRNLRKINMLCQSGIRYFKEFLNTLRGPDHTFPERFEADVERPGLIAHFYIARLYSKIIPDNPTNKIANLIQSLENYSFVTKYVHINEEAAACIMVELDICKDMVSVLPKTMDRLASEI